MNIRSFGFARALPVDAMCFCEGIKCGSGDWIVEADTQINTVRAFTRYPAQPNMHQSVSIHYMVKTVFRLKCKRHIMKRWTKIKRHNSRVDISLRFLMQHKVCAACSMLVQSDFSRLLTFAMPFAHTAPAKLILLESMRQPCTALFLSVYTLFYATFINV